MKSKIFVINLDRSEDRLISITKQFGKLEMDFERICALDGQNLSNEQIDKYYSSKLNKKHYFVPLSKNEIACYQSHLKAMKKIIDDNLDYAIVLEDDVVLSEGFKYINEILNSIKEPWECVKLINHKNKKKVIESKKISVDGLPENLNIECFKYIKDKKEYLKECVNKEESSDLELVRWNKLPILAAAYVIKKEAAKKFINAYPKCYRPIDVDLQFPWEHKIDIQGIAPNLVKLDESKESSIGHKKQKKHYPLARIIYKLKYLINSKLKS